MFLIIINSSITNFFYYIATENSKMSVKLCCMVTGCAKQLDAAGNLEIVLVVLRLVRKLSDN